jgi:hypothetical protein
VLERQPRDNCQVLLLRACLRVHAKLLPLKNVTGNENDRIGQQWDRCRVLGLMDVVLCKNV